MSNRLESLTSIRFFAAFFVVLSHLGFLQGSSLEFLFVEDGFIGVTLFFILSGFVLTYSYQARFLQQKISYLDFFIRRLFRIYPLHLLTLILAIPLSLSLVNLLAFIPNLLLIQSWIPIKSVYFSLNAPSWSISSELFFYACFPFLVVLSRKILLSIFALLIAVQIGILTLPDADDLKHALLYISPFFRISDFILGILLCHLYQTHAEVGKNKALLLQLSALATLFVFIVLAEMFSISQPYKFSLYYIVPMAFLIFAFCFQSRFSTILSNKYLLILGESSFALYLIHQLIIRYGLMLHEHYSQLNLEILAIVMILLSVLSGILLYYIFEKPCQKYLATRYQARQEKAQRVLTVEKNKSLHKEET